MSDEKNPLRLGRQAWTSHKTGTPDKIAPSKPVSLTGHKVPNPAPVKTTLPKVTSDTAHKSKS